MTSDANIAEQSVIRFLISNQEFAVSADAVAEVVELPDCTQIPQTPRYVAGVFVRKGHVVAVLDLPEWLGLRVTGAHTPKAIVIEHNEFVFAVQVDRVFGLENIEFTTTEDDRYGLTNRLNTLTTATNSDNELVALLDLDALLTATVPRPM